MRDTRQMALALLDIAAKHCDVPTERLQRGGNLHPERLAYARGMAMHEAMERGASVRLVAACCRVDRTMAYWFRGVYETRWMRSNNGRDLLPLRDELQKFGGPASDGAPLLRMRGRIFELERRRGAFEIVREVEA